MLYSQCFKPKQEYFMCNINGSMLRKLRAINALTQDQIAQILDIDSPTISRYECDRKDSALTRFRIINAINDYAVCYDILESIVSDIDYYDKDEYERDRMQRAKQRRGYE